MQLRLITLSLDPDTGSFPEDPLRDLDGRPISVVEHFFHHEGLPHLLLIVQLEGRSEPRPIQNHEAVSSTLAPHERPVFERLRAWRNGRSEAEGVPPYTLFTNKQLVEIARLRPTTLTALKVIRGVGDKKAEKFGADVLQLVADPGSTGG